MQIIEWLTAAHDSLQKAGVPTARLDSLILLEDVIGKDRAYLLAHPETPVQGPILDKLEKQLIRRAAHEPLAYIRGKSEFYGREFIVSADTLQPRPETEAMITLLKTLELPEKPVIADIGTGSGCIAVTSALELPNSEVIAVELSNDALSIAMQNAKKFHVSIELLHGNLLEPVTNHRLDVILANLPYVPNFHTINQAAMHEPDMAIFGGPDGLSLYRRLFQQITQLQVMPAYILTECLPPQHSVLSEIATTTNSYRLQQAHNLVQVFARKSRSVQ